MRATIELRDLRIETDIGTYGPDDVVPDAHILDMSLIIAPNLVFIEADGVDAVFDYDPLLHEIDALARDGHYHTQERLMTRIVGACAAYPEIEAISLTLRKTPVLGMSGSLGVSLEVGPDVLDRLREKARAA